MDVSLASLDSDGHVGSWQTLDLRGSRDPQPSFSADGSEFAYVARNADPNRRDLVLRNLATGHERVIYESPYATLDCQFSFPKHQVVSKCTVGKEDGRIDLVSIDAGSGAVEQMASFPEFRFLLQPPTDDRFFFLATGSYAIGSPLSLPIVRWDGVTHQEMVVLSPSDKLIPERPSLDGRWVIRFLDGTFSVRPLEGGDWKPLVSGVIRSALTPVTTPDGNWFMYIDSDSSGKRRLFRVSTAGGTPQLVGDLPVGTYSGRIYFRADGRQILAQNSSTFHYNMWVLKNFEPPAQK